MNINHSALIGLGAVGTVYGKLLYETYGDGFHVIATGSRFEKLKQIGAALNETRFYPDILSCEVAPDIDILIVAVKNYQLSAAIEDIRPFVGKNTVILTLLNGITAQDALSVAFPDNTVLYGLSIYIDALKTADGVINTTNGIIQFGNADNTEPTEEVLAVDAYLQGAGIKTEIGKDMIFIMWRKFLMNVGINQVSAITGSPYGHLVDIEPIRTLVRDSMLEVVAIAKAKGIDLSESDITAFEAILANFSPLGKTSMLQDIEAKRKTEVEYFAGTVISLGKQLSIPTPVNDILLRLILAIEALY